MYDLDNGVGGINWRQGQTSLVLTGLQIKGVYTRDWTWIIK